MIDWIEENIEGDPALGKMASHVGYSAFYCSAKFHEYVGISFKEYIVRRRLSLAAEALRNTNTSIIEIALQYGFSSHEAFTRAFKRVYGCPPNRYRLSRPHIPLFERAQIMQ